MQAHRLTPIVLLEAGRMLQSSCLDCGLSSPLDLARLADNGTLARHPINLLMKAGLLSCPACHSVHLMLASAGDGRGGEHLLLARNPCPTGELVARKNVSVQGSHDSLFIPYGCDGKDASSRAPYVDLKKQPDGVDHLPEIKSAGAASADFGGRNLFRGLVREINTGSQLTTLGCAWESAYHDGQWLTYGYVDVARCPLETNSYPSMVQLAMRLVDVLCCDARADTRFILTIKLGIYRLRPIFVLDIEAIAAAATEKAAFLLWEKALDDLGRALRDGVPDDYLQQTQRSVYNGTLPAVPGRLSNPGDFA